MSDDAGCPKPPELQRLLLGRPSDPDTERLERHVESCARCAQSLLQLEGDDSLLPLVRAQPAAGRPKEGVVADLIARLKRLPAASAREATTASPAATASAPGGPEATPTDAITHEVVGLLAAPRGPDEIGWLGRYRVLKVLGAGGMGVVFEAEDGQLQRRVALKVIRPALAGSPAARQRFLREARATAAVEHDHIVTVYHADEDRGVPFLAMPLLKGETLEGRLQRQGRLPLAEVLRIGRETAAGLAAAHEARLIHRDIKPSNIWLEGKSGRVKILDFGLAQAGDESGKLTGSGVIAGTPAYMAPEQARDEPLDHRCDLFSLGCVLYRLATGELPFRGTTPVQLLRSLELDQPRPPRDLNAEVPPALAGLIVQLLAKDRGQRPASAEAVVQALERMGLAVSLQETSLLPAPGGTGPIVRRRRLLAGVAALLGALGLGGSLFGPAAYHSLADRGRVGGDVNGPANEVVGPADQQPPEEPPGEIRSLKGHLGAVGPVVCSAYGSRALSGSWDSTLRLWDLNKGDELRHFDGHTGWVWSVALSSDGRQALSAGGVDRTARLWDVETGQELGRLWRPVGRFVGAAFTPGGPRAVCDGGEADDVLRLWDVASRQELRRFAGHTARVWRVAFAAGGRRLLSAGRDGTARLWDVETGQELCAFTGHTAAVLTVALSPDGREALSAGEDQVVRLWDTATGRELRRFEGHSGFVEGVAFSPDGRRLLSAGHDQTLRLWDVASGKELCRLEGHTGVVAGVAFTPDGRRALSTGGDGTVRLWRLPRTPN
jgi:hypothetical protein